MIDTTKETLVPVKACAELFCEWLPRPPHLNTIRRWANGIGVPEPLETISVAGGRRLMTSHEAIRRFCERTHAANTNGHRKSRRKVLVQ